MKLILCSRERSENAISELRKILHNEDYRVICDFTDISIPDSVILDWYSKEYLRQYYDMIRNAEKISFLFHDFILDTADNKYIIQMEQKALNEKNWALCKAINEVKIEINILMQNMIMDSMPFEVQLESTDFCNANCIMCSHFYKNGNLFITDNAALIDRLAPIYPYLRTVYLHGNGEPFLVKGMEEYLNHLAEYDIHFTTNTNLSVVTDQMLVTLKNHFSDLNISCDSGNKKTYEYIRRNLKFEKFVENCKKVRRGCPELYMRMWSIVMRQNVFSLSETVEFAADLGFDEIVFTQLSTNTMLENQKDTMVLYPQILRQQLDIARKFGERLNIKVTAPDILEAFDLSEYEIQKKMFDSEPLFRNENDFYDLYRKIRSMSNLILDKKISSEKPSIYSLECSFMGICDWCVERPFIALNGDVSVCCINRNLKIGNIYKSSFEDIWNSPQMQYFRKFFYNGKLPSVCSGCEFMMQNSLHHLKILDWKDELRRKQL